MENKQLEKLNFIKQSMQDMPTFSAMPKKQILKRKIKEPKVVYIFEGSEEENQQRIDDIFDYIFETAIKKEGNDLGLLTSIDKM